ncbi:MAG: hypothetical protein ACREDQ_06665, partial [Limisphaerales bacterium]
MPESLVHVEEIRKAFAEYDRKVNLHNVQVGCVIGAVFMPVGTVLDYWIYRSDLIYFLELRLLCAALIGIFWAIAVTRFGHRHSRKLGVLLAMFPAFFISWMIYTTEGANSPYYAGLNIVLLVVGIVVHWTFIESFIAVSLVMLMYVGACALHGNTFQAGLANNLYFLALTGIVIVTGSYFNTQLRF